MSRAAAPIRVAIDAGPLYGSRTGVGVATEGIVDVLGSRDDVVLSPYLISGRATPEPGHRRLPMPGIVASHVWARTSWPRADRWVGDVDVVHGTNYVVPPTSRPSVVTVYDCWFLRHPERATPVVRRSGEQLRRAVARGATVVVSSDATAREATELLATERVRTIHLGPPAPVSRTSTGDIPARFRGLAGKPLILAIGTEEQRKGYPDLVGAFCELVDGGVDDVELVIAGRPGDASAAVDTAVQAGSAAARERLHRVGPVDAGEKAWLMGAAAVLAYPSLDEGFGFPILEAQQAGVPIVARSVGSIPEVAGRGAVLVDDAPDLSTEFAASLERALADDSLRDGLVRAGTANLERFCWQRTGDELVNTYTEVISS